MMLFRKIRNLFTIGLVRPYIRNELPGWGVLYGRLVGYHSTDPEWKEDRVRWIRGKLHGYEMPLDLGSWMNRYTFFLGRYYDLGTQLLMQSFLKEGDTFVDIGANEGMISLLGSRLVGSSGKVIAFEPNQKPRSVLEAAIDRNKIRNIQLHPIGLSDEPGFLSLTVPNSNSGEGSFGRSVLPHYLVQTVECPVEVGDDRLIDERPALIKIDVEGFEAKVLRGIEKTIKMCYPPIVTEISSKHLKNASSSIDEVCKILKDHGYESQRIAIVKQKRKYVLALHKQDPRSFDGDEDYLWTRVCTQ